MTTCTHTTADLGLWWPYIDQGKTPWRVKTLRMGEKTLHEEKTQVNREGIQRGAYRIDSTANDMSEWMQEKKDMRISKGGGTHANMISTNLLFCDMTSSYMKLTNLRLALRTFDCFNLISKGRKFNVMQNFNKSCPVHWLLAFFSQPLLEDFYVDLFSIVVVFTGHDLDP